MRTWASACLALALLLGAARAVDHIYIGGIFNQFYDDDNATVNYAGADNMAAFLMAVDEINNKTDGTSDWLLPDYRIEFNVEIGYGFKGAIDAADKFDKSLSIHSVVIGIEHGEHETSAILQMLAVESKLGVVCVDTDASLSKGSEYPYKVRTAASEASMGHILQSLLCEHFHYQRIAIISTTGYYSSQSVFELLTEEYCTFETLVHVEVEPGYLDFTHELHEAKASGALVYVMLVDHVTAAALMIQGHKYGMFGENTIVFGHEYIVTSKIEDTMLKHQPSLTSDDIDVMMRSYFGIKIDPLYYVTHTTTGQGFRDRWYNQANTLSPECSNRTDYNSTHYLFSSAPVTVDVTDPTWSDYSCAGLNTDYSNFDDYVVDDYIETNKTLSRHVGNVYDGVYALATAYHSLLYGKNNYHLNNITGDTLLNELVNHTNFVGATGNISFIDYLEVDGGASAEIFGRGDRKSGQVALLYNYDSSMSDKWFSVGRWEYDGGFQICDETMLDDYVGVLEECKYDAVYNTPGNRRPSDRYPDIVLEVPLGVKVVLLILAITGFIMIAVTAGFVCTHMSSKLIKASQPYMMLYILLGEAVLGVRVIFSTLPISTGVCRGNLWLGHLSFSLIFTGLFLKMWRVDKILNGNSFRRVKITEADILVYAGVVLVLTIIYLIFVDVFGGMYVHLDITTQTNQDTYSYTCHEHHMELEDALFGIESFFVLWAIRLCVAVKDAPSAVNESASVAAAMSVIIGIAGLTMPIIYLLSLNSDVVEVITGFAYVLVMLATLGVLYAPKMLALYYGETKNKDIDLAPKRADKVYTEESSDSYDADKVLESVYKKVLRQTKNLDERFALCQRQITYWRNMLMVVEEKNSGSGSGTTAATSAMSLQSSASSAVQDSVKIVSYSASSAGHESETVKAESHSASSAGHESESVNG